MLKYIAIGIIAIGIGAFWLSKNSEPKNLNLEDTVERATITLTKSGFEPQDVVLKKGGTIKFDTETERPFWPASNLHPKHDIYPEFDPKRALDSFESWSFTFNELGNWTYHDHLRSYYRGVIYVVE